MYSSAKEQITSKDSSTSSYAMFKNHNKVANAVHSQGNAGTTASSFSNYVQVQTSSSNSASGGAGGGNKVDMTLMSGPAPIMQGKHKAVSSASHPGAIH